MKDSSQGETCRNCRELIGAALDNELSSGETAELMGHLDSCPHCREEWDKFLAVKAGIKNILEKEPVPAHLEKNLSAALAKESGRSKRRQSITMAMAAILVALTGLAFLNGKSLTEKSNSSKISSNAKEQAAAQRLAEIVDATSHNTDNTNCQDCLVNFVGRKAGDEMTKLAGFAVLDSKLGSFELSGSDLVQVKDGNKLVRLCYTSKTDKRVNCIDVYQAPSGTITIAQATEIEINGKKLRQGKIGHQAVVQYTAAGTDLTFVSPLSQEELTALVKPNV